MRCYPHNIGREPRVQLQRTMLPNRLDGTVQGPRKRQLPVRPWLLLLDLSLYVVEGETAGGGKEAGDGAGTCKQEGSEWLVNIGKDSLLTAFPGWQSGLLIGCILQNRKIAG